MSFRHVMLEWSNIITKFSANKQNLISLSIFMYVAMATAHTSAKLSEKKTEFWVVNSRVVILATKG